ncbi:hypothetical protein L1887_29558 [Cichorium endivia]|nr:hypothetical protein L1887_29558 [Cichorium endivia]
MYARSCGQNLTTLKPPSFTSLCASPFRLHFGRPLFFISFLLHTLIRQFDLFFVAVSSPPLLRLAVYQLGAVDA